MNSPADHYNPVYCSPGKRSQLPRSFQYLYEKWNIMNLIKEIPTRIRILWFMINFYRKYVVNETSARSGSRFTAILRNNDTLNFLVTILKWSRWPERLKHLFIMFLLWPPVFSAAIKWKLLQMLIFTIFSSFAKWTWYKISKDRR